MQLHRCSFNLAVDHPESAEWRGPPSSDGDESLFGFVDVFFRCVARGDIHRKCWDGVDGRPVQVRADSATGESAFLATPVYPKYYVGGRTCRYIQSGNFSFAR